MINRTFELNSHPTVLIAAAVIELKPNEANARAIELTHGTVATVTVE